MELCLFQGTFNPIHNAHIKIAEYALEHFAKDGVTFIPAYLPPHKQSDSNITNHRYKMVELVVSEHPDFKISDIEYQRKGKSYTYLTVLELYKIHKPKTKIKFLIGTDAFKKIETWYESDKLKNMLDFYVFKRENGFDETEIVHLKNKGYDYTILPLEFTDISSTEIRNLIRQNKSLKGLVPKRVEEYIKENELYKD